MLIRASNDTVPELPAWLAVKVTSKGTESLGAMCPRNVLDHSQYRSCGLQTFAKIEYWLAAVPVFTTQNRWVFALYGVT